jgi:hypothetical protein
MYVNGKMSLIVTIPEMGGEGKKENDGGGKFCYDLFYILQQV